MCDRIICRINENIERYNLLSVKEEQKPKSFKSASLKLQAFAAIYFPNWYLWHLKYHFIILGWISHGFINVCIFIYLYPDESTNGTSMTKKTPLWVAGKGCECERAYFRFLAETLTQQDAFQTVTIELSPWSIKECWRQIFSWADLFPLAGKKESDPTSRPPYPSPKPSWQESPVRRLPTFLGAGEVTRSNWVTMILGFDIMIMIMLASSCWE